MEVECVECGSINGVEKWNGIIPLCKKHYLQLHRHGRVFKRTTFDANTIYIYASHAELGLYNKQGDETARALISLEDIEHVKKYKWCLGGNGYVSCKKVLLHREVMGVNTKIIIDHINGNTLDNRRENLRLCNASQNAINAKLSVANTSGTKGVGYDSHKKKWTATIQINGKNKLLGRYENKDDAINKRLVAETEHYKEYVRGVKQCSAK